MNRSRARNTGLIVLAFTTLCGIALGTLLFFVLSQWVTQDYSSSSASSNSENEGVNSQPAAPSDPIGGEPSASRGSLAPDFQLRDLGGDWVNLSDYQGQVVLINFWATWCSPCREEMPIFQSYYESFAELGFVILAVSSDSLDREVEDFRDDLGLSFPILIDSREDVQDLYRIWTYPTTFILDREGIIRYVHYGSMTGSQLESYLTGVGISL
jgi:peroxiredoxin